jgi:hypothetical protein
MRDELREQLPQLELHRRRPRTGGSPHWLQDRVRYYLSPAMGATGGYMAALPPTTVDLVPRATDKGIEIAVEIRAMGGMFAHLPLTWVVIPWERISDAEAFLLGAIG